ncbi:MAG: MBL fold metallo-hydrolase [Firmicutes bacterium]|nr:MBL fold metallo-hydrolase [Bacillota bacterium]
MSVRISHIVVGIYQENTYFLKADDNSTVVVDPGGSGKEIEKYINDNGLKVSMVINTHGHPDHTEANKYMKEKYGMPVYIHPEDAQLFGITYDQPLTDGQEIDFNGNKLKIMLTPGHTFGSVCIKGDGFLITGDTIFEGTIGRTDLGGDSRVMMHTLKTKFNDIPDETVLYPGHGDSTTMGNERKFNPYLS